MDKGSRWSVVRRALVYGACMGALVGGPVFGALFVLVPLFVFGAVGDVLPMIGLGLLVTAIGGVSGGVIGLFSAILPGAVAAWKRDGFRRRPRVARVSAAALSGLEIDTVFVIAKGGPAAAAATSGGVAFLVLAFVLFAAAGAYGLEYVVTGRTCKPARRALRRTRRMCPCRRFRLSVVPGV
jgi:hypothetical protein